VGGFTNILEFLMEPVLSFAKRFEFPPPPITFPPPVALLLCSARFTFNSPLRTARLPFSPLNELHFHMSLPLFSRSADRQIVMVFLPFPVLPLPCSFTQDGEFNRDRRFEFLSPLCGIALEDVQRASHPSCDFLFETLQWPLSTQLGSACFLLDPSLRSPFT